MKRTYLMIAALSYLALAACGSEPTPTPTPTPTSTFTPPSGEGLCERKPWKCEVDRVPR